MMVVPFVIGGSFFFCFCSLRSQLFWVSAFLVAYLSYLGVFRLEFIVLGRNTTTDGEDSLRWNLSEIAFYFEVEEGSFEVSLVCV